jgi:hypothetical protein
LKNEITKQISDYTQLYFQNVNNANKILTEINTITNENSSISNLESVINPLGDLINDYKEFLSGLHIEQLTAIANLIPLFTIFFFFFYYKYNNFQ